MTAVLDANNGSMVAQYNFGPFGEPINETGEIDACPFRWQTKYYDAECQHYYFGYRHYDPRVGRWLSRDPLRERGGFNLYAYCGNDPVNENDPLGLSEKYGRQWSDRPLKVPNTFRGFAVPYYGGYAFAEDWAYQEIWVEPPQDDYLAIGELFLEGLREKLADDVEELSEVDLSDPELIRAFFASFNPLAKAEAAIDSASEIAQQIATIWASASGNRGKLAYDGGKAAAAPAAALLIRKLIKTVRKKRELPPGFDPAKGFPNFESFKSAFGPAGQGKAWHHIVEQTINSGRFAPQILHNPANLFKLPHGAGSIHAKVSGYYSRKVPGLTGNKTVREWLSGKSFKEQFEFGIDVIKQFGGVKYLPNHLR